MVIFSQMIRGGASTSLLYFLLCSRFVPEKLPRGQQILCFVGCWALLCVDGHWAVQLTATAMAAVGAAYFLGQARTWKMVLFAALFTGLYAAAYLCGRMFAEGTANTALLTLSVLQALVLCAAALGKHWRPAAVQLLPLIPSWLAQVLLCGVCIWQKGKLGIEIVQFLAMLWCLYCTLSFLPASKRVEKALLARSKAQEAARQYALQEEYYQELLQKQTQTRALWHDLNKYLRAAKAETAPSKALQQLESMLEDATAIVDVGNSVVNVILNEYIQSAKALGIELRMKVQVPENLFVSAADLYILIGNTMDNAIEACRSLPQHQRFIELTLRTHQDILYYKIANPYEGTVKRPKDAMRGHGLDNARRSVENYDGQLLTKTEQGFFIVSAHMNKPPQIDA